MPDPFLFIVGLIAIACVILFPIRLWRRRHHRYGNETTTRRSSADARNMWLARRWSARSAVAESGAGGGTDSFDRSGADADRGWAR